jgi:hypothetical protein
MINKKTSTADPLRGGAGDLGRPPGRLWQRSGSVHHQRKNHHQRAPRRCSWRSERRCRRSKSTHHKCKKRRRRDPWEVLPEIRERPPSMLKMSTAGPLGGGVEDPGAPPINAKDINGGPSMKRWRRSESAHNQHKKYRRRAPRPPWEVGSDLHLRSEKCVGTCIGMIDKQ